MTDYPEDADGMVLARLAADGVDMSQPRLIEFAVDVPDETAAKAVAQALTARDYEIEIDFDEGEELEEEDDPELAEELGPSWSVYVNVTMVPEYERIVAIQDKLAELVEPLGGIVDGWGACVE